MLSHMKLAFHGRMQLRIPLTKSGKLAKILLHSSKWFSLMYSVVHDPNPLVKHTSVATGYFLVIRALQRATRNPDRATIGSLAPICPPLVYACSWHSFPLSIYSSILQWQHNHIYNHLYSVSVTQGTYIALLIIILYIITWDSYIML